MDESQSAPYATAWVGKESRRTITLGARPGSLRDTCVRFTTGRPKVVAGIGAVGCAYCLTRLGGIPLLGNRRALVVGRNLLRPRFLLAVFVEAGVFTR